MECLVTTADSKNIETPMFGDGQSHEIGRSLRDETTHFDDKQVCVRFFSHKVSRYTDIFVPFGSWQRLSKHFNSEMLFSKTSSFYMLQFLPCDMT